MQAGLLFDRMSHAVTICREIAEAVTVYAVHSFVCEACSTYCEKMGHTMHVSEMYDLVVCVTP